jgi:hypothetical protein
MDRLAQRSAADTVLQRQVGFDNFGALRELPVDDIGLDAASIVEAVSDMNCQQLKSLSIEFAQNMRISYNIVNNVY